MGKLTRNLKTLVSRPERRIVGNYRLEKTMAAGLYGKIKLARHLPTSQKVVIKIVEKKKLDIVYHEAELLAQLKHSNIVRLLEVLETPENLYIVCDYIEGGELYDYIMEKNHLEEDEARRMWRQLLSAVDYMHTRNIAHRDLKLENVMLDDNKNVVLIDLGLGSFITPGRPMTTFCGSVAYAAPEMFMSQSYMGPAIDIWSLGVTLYCMIMGYLPFEDPSRVVDADYIPLNEPIDDTGAFTPVSPEFAQLIKSIFQKDPSKRITMEELRSHPFTTNNGRLPALPSPTPEIGSPMLVSPQSSSPVAPSPLSPGGLVNLGVLTQKRTSLPMPLCRSFSPPLPPSPLIGQTANAIRGSNGSSTNSPTTSRLATLLNGQRRSSNAACDPAISQPAANIVANAHEMKVKPLAYSPLPLPAPKPPTLVVSTQPHRTRTRAHTRTLSNPHKKPGSQVIQHPAVSKTPGEVDELQLIEQLAAYGFDKEATMASVQAGMYDSSTASLYLLRKQLTGSSDAVPQFVSMQA